MLEYFRSYYIEMNMGPGYVMTNIFYVVAIVLLLRPAEQMKGRGLFHGITDMFLLWLGSVFICGTGFALFGRNMLVDRVMMIALLLIYAIFFSKYKPVTRLVRSFVYFSCTLQIIPISEPIGEWFEEIDPTYVWAEHFTWVIVIGLGMMVLLFLIRYSTEDLTFVPVYPCVLLGTIALIGTVWQILSPYLKPERVYNILVAGAFLAITILGYFMFYTVSREYDRNLGLLAIQHKQTLDEELLLFSKENYSEIHELRHELKNHMSYIKLMAEAGEYQKLKEYAATVCGEAEGIFSFVECGNQVINAVMNHAIRQGELMGVKVESQIVLPPVIPFKETEFCSLLSNLMENAMEAARLSGDEEPVVLVRIRPQLDYLFIHVDNPVNDSLPPQRRLSLKTTKADEKLHGYGTRIIQNLVKKYRGSVKFDMRDGRFYADVMLCLVQEENHGEDESCDLR